MNAIRDAICKLADDQALSDELALEVARQILSGDATPAQIGAFLTGLRIRGETPGHILAFAQVMRTHATPISVDDPESLVDTCGTGGDGAGTFNISTAAALIAAGAGARIAKHGNRAVTGNCGSADVLKTLGVNVDMSPETAARCLRETGCSFLFAPAFHGAMRHAGPTRREIGIRTIFNMLGPLSNPAAARRQLIGVYDRRLTDIFARVLTQLGSIHVMVVHGSDGLDEITLTGPTQIAEARDGKLVTYAVTPEELGLERVSPEDLSGGSPDENARIIGSILSGEPSPRRQIAEVNAAAALVVAGRAASIPDGLLQTRNAIESAAARRILDRLITVSNEREHAAV